jgi:DNA-binding MarR family transcriptional regulator
MNVNKVDNPGYGSFAGPESGVEGPTRVPPALAPHVGFLVFAAFMHAQRTAVAALRGELHPRLLVVLRAIDDGPISQGELGARLDLGRTTMVGIVDALEAKGLVERRRDPADRRAYQLVVTPTGTEALARFGPVLRECEGAFLGRLSMDERARLNELLQGLLAGFDDTGPPTSLMDRPGFLLARSHLRLRTEFERAIEPLEIQARHFGALAICAHTPGSQQSLARELGVSGTIIVELVDALEEHGLAERRQNALDRRSYIIAPTAQGTAALEHARGALAEIDDRIAGAVGGRHALDELGALLRKMLGVA